jgi:hypothetical protein
LSARTSLVAATALAAILSLTLGGCTYDYLQHTDRVAYSAGDAVRANIESETTNPSSDTMYKTKGLGRNGVVVGVATGEAPPAE